MSSQFSKHHSLSNQTAPLLHRRRYLRLTARFPHVISEKDLELITATVANEGATVGINKTIDRAH